MNLHAAFLARRAAANSDGTFDATSGGIGEFQASDHLSEARIVLRFSVVLRLEVGEDETDRIWRVAFQIFFRGRPIGSLHRVPIYARRVAGAEHFHSNVILNLQYEVPGPGAGHVEIAVDGSELRIPRLHFEVVP